MESKSNNILSGKKPIHAFWGVSGLANYIPQDFN
jgi:hypothetical protein